MNYESVFCAVSTIKAMKCPAIQERTEGQAILSQSTTRAQKAGKLRAFQQVIDRGFP